MSDDSGTDDTDGDTYVHTPSDPHGAKPRGADREFGLRGWLLVGWLFISLLVVPSILFYLPRAGAVTASLGLGYRDAFLVLPLLPALGLGLLAVWTTTRP